MRTGYAADVVAALVLALATGCATEAAPGVEVGSIAAQDYCQAIAGGLCAWQERCGCETRASCSEVVAQCEMGFAEALALIDAGRTRYDGLATRRLADRIASATCDQDTWEVLGYRLADTLTFGGVLNGTLRPGSACTVANQERDDVADNLGLSIECERGFCRDGACMAFRDVGEPCDETVRCLDFSIERWDPDSPPRLACEGTCQPLLADGEPCTHRGECASHTCEGGECSPRGIRFDALVEGEPCTDRFECRSQACERGVCVAAACSPDVE